jgi:RNA polymerase sigma-70 factor (ECF subfamily)
MNIEEEHLLVEKAKTNIQAFDALYSLYAEQIYIYIIHRIGMRELAEDLTSEVFLAAVEGIAKFDTSRGVRFRSWLYRTAHNKIVDYFRKNKKMSSTELESLQLKSQNTTPEESVALSQRKLEAIATIQTLNKRYQHIITLRFYSEFEIAEISEILDIKPQRVSVLLHRALQSFKKKFKKLFPESEIFT